MTTKKTTTELRRCTGSARFGIEPHDVPVTAFPKQPSRKDGLGTMCTEHWRAYVKGLRAARKAAQATDGPEADAASRDRLLSGPGRTSGAFPRGLATDATSTGIAPRGRPVAVVGRKVPRPASGGCEKQALLATL